MLEHRPFPTLSDYRKYDIDFQQTELFCYTDLNQRKKKMISVVRSFRATVTSGIGLFKMGKIGSILVYNTGQGSAGGIPHSEGLHTRIN